MSASSGSPTADLLLVNGRVTMLDPANPEADAVAIADGRILAVGRRRDLAVTTAPDTQVIDLGGAPGGGLYPRHAGTAGRGDPA